MFSFHRHYLYQQGITSLPTRHHIITKKMDGHNSEDVLFFEDRSKAETAAVADEQVPPQISLADNQHPDITESTGNWAENFMSVKKHELAKLKEKKLQKRKGKTRRGGRKQQSNNSNSNNGNVQEQLERGADYGSDELEAMLDYMHNASNDTEDQEMLKLLAKQMNLGLDIPSEDDSDNDSSDDSGSHSEDSEDEENSEDAEEDIVDIDHPSDDSDILESELAAMGVFDSDDDDDDDDDEEDIIVFGRKGRKAARLSGQQTSSTAASSRQPPRSSKGKGSRSPSTSSNKSSPTQSNPLSKNQRRRIMREAAKQKKSRKAERLALLKSGADKQWTSADILPHLNNVNYNLRDFLNTEYESMPLAPMPSGIRRYAKKLISYYNLRIKTRGSGNKKLLVVIKTQKSSLPPDWTTLPQQIVSASPVSKAKLPKPKRDGATPREGTVVGAAAAPIDEENKGHKLLRMMGWKPGDTIGAEGNKGRDEAVEAIVKRTRSGLGYE